VISVDTKKKELVGAFQNKGRTWRPQGQPYPVKVHDFPSPAEGKAIPYGTYDVRQNRAVVNVGISHDMAEFQGKAFGAGGAWRGGDGIARPAGCRSVRMPDGATTVEGEPGR
jgi:hypothetical protein